MKKRLPLLVLVGPENTFGDSDELVDTAHGVGRRDETDFDECGDWNFLPGTTEWR
jgi:hypothetical protein